MRTRWWITWGLLAAAASTLGCARLLAREPAPPDEAQPATPAPRGLLPLGRDDGVKVAADIRGKVIAVDKMLGVVVINIGEQHGVRARMGLTVFRGDRFVGKIVIEETYPDMASARYGRTVKMHVEIGDQVASRLAPEL